MGKKPNKEKSLEDLAEEIEQIANQLKGKNAERLARIADALQRKAERQRHIDDAAEHGGLATPGE